MLYVWVLDANYLSSPPPIESGIKFQKVQVHTHLLGSQLVTLLTADRQHEEEEYSVLVID